MRQTRLRLRRGAAKPEATVDAPRRPAADTSAACELLAKIDQVLAD